MPYHDSEYDELEEREYPDPDEPDGAGEDTVRCPSCREWVYAQAEQCPYCGHYIRNEELAADRKPLWVVAAAIFLLGWILWFWVYLG